jgi:hypothetical protein
MPAVLELRAVADRRDDGGGGLGSDVLDLSDAPARLALDEHLIDLLVERCDPAIETPEEVDSSPMASRAIAVSSLAASARISGMRRWAWVMLLAIAMPRSRRRPRIWLTTAVR